jgi:hypothetical protein
VAALLVLLGSVAAQAQVGSNACNESLTRYVYNPYRFYTPKDEKNKTPLRGSCVQVRGRITVIKPPGPDGDVHISIDPDTKSLLRPGQWALVVEAVCVNPNPPNGYANKACKGFQNPSGLTWSRLRTFKRGQRVQLIGLQVIDYEHRKRGWTEIHPLTRIERLPDARR